ncbi:MAG: ZIP family metal transporter [Thermoplasmata archaeon]
MISGSFYNMLGLTLLMGFSIYLSFPIILRRKMEIRTTVLLVSFAVGILVFLVADIFSDVSSQIYSNGSYVANPLSTLIFIISVGGLFSILYFIENPRMKAGRHDQFIPRRVALIVAIGMGLQNLTEGLVFGSAYVVGLTGLFLVIFVGFVLQNFTEGFPIVSPFIGFERPRVLYLAGLYFIGGFPTVAGSLIGYYYADPYFNVLFDGLAVGAIIYVMIPMLRNLFKQAESVKSNSLVYTGIILGFLIGFAVNAI